jgi:hypothetical protein
MMDATACWLPIVAILAMTTTERLDGNGAAYKLKDLGDLVRAAGEPRDPETRRRLGTFGAQTMTDGFSGESIATRRSGTMKLRYAR